MCSPLNTEANNVRLQTVSENVFCESLSWWISSKNNSRCGRLFTACGWNRKWEVNSAGGVAVTSSCYDSILLVYRTADRPPAPPAPEPTSPRLNHMTNLQRPLLLAG